MERPRHRWPPPPPPPPARALVEKRTPALAHARERVCLECTRSSIPRIVFLLQQPLNPSSSPRDVLHIIFRLQRVRYLRASLTIMTGLSRAVINAHSLVYDPHGTVTIPISMNRDWESEPPLRLRGLVVRISRCKSLLEFEREGDGTKVAENTRK